MSDLLIDHPASGVVPTTLSSGFHVEVEGLLVFRIGKLVSMFDVFTVRLGPGPGPARAKPEKDVLRTVDFNFDASASLPELHFNLQCCQMSSDKLNVFRFVPVLLPWLQNKVVKLFHVVSKQVLIFSTIVCPFNGKADIK